MTIPPSAVASKQDLREITNRSLIPGLNALRVVAVALVILSHEGLPFSGSLGVTIFFVLSGFLITTLLLREFSKTNDLSFRRFYVRRMYRIFPAFYVCWIATVLCTQHVRWSEALAAFFYVSDYARAFLPLPRQINFFFGISWSLAVEEQFYLLWPVMLLWALRRHKRPEITIGLFVISIWLWRAILLKGFSVPLTYLYNAFDTRVDALFVGGLLAVLIRQAHIAPIAARFAARSWVLWCALAGLIVLNYADLLSVAPLTFYTISPILIAFLILCLLLRAEGWPLLEHPFIQFVAKISYSLYLYQILGMAIRNHVHIAHLQRLMTLPVIFGFAVASYYFVEKPFLKLRDAQMRSHTRWSA